MIRFMLKAVPRLVDDVARRMLEMEADSQYADVMERALYNTVLGGMALDGKHFFYVNPLEVHPKTLAFNHTFMIT